MRLWLIAMICLATVATTCSVLAQTAVPQSQLGPSVGSAPPNPTREGKPNPDAAPEIAPHAAGVPELEPSSTETPGDSANPLTSVEP